MTLAAERGLEWPSSMERRGAAFEPRRSWASLHPFERRRTSFNDESAREHLWRRVGVTYRRRVVAVDAAVAGTAVAVLLAGARPADAALWVHVAAAAAVFVLLVAVCRGYDTRELGDGPLEFQALMRAGAASAVLLMTLAYLSGLDVPRELIGVGVPAVVGVSVLLRYLQRRFLHRARAHGQAMMRTLVVGDAESAGRVVTDLAAAPYHGYQVTGVCLPSVDHGTAPGTVPVVGAVADVAQIVADRAIDVVVVAGSHLNGDALRRLSWALDRANAQLIVAPDLVEVTSPRLTLRPTAGLSLLEVEVGAPRGRMLAKAVLDRTLGLTLGLVILPVVLAAALAVRATSSGPAFYRQTRVGVDGHRFTLWKLRSMYVDADARRSALLAANEGNEVLFKLRRDPRVTPVGRVLRRFSLDELPQLLNVIKGDMSLVGPRPPLVEEVEGYADAVHRRLRVKPGLTGLWQVSGRSDLTWDEAVRLDLRYVDNWSLAMDLQILWKTGRAVLGGSGAY